MTTAESTVYFDPFDLDIKADPYPVYRRLRDEAPLYYNQRHDFYLVSRYDDVQRCLAEQDVFLSSRGGTINVIKSKMPSPPGLFINEDPPKHTTHRRIVSVLFTPRSMSRIEPQIREFCAKRLDSLAARDHFDFVRDIGAEVPMRVVGMLVGIPQQDQEHLRDQFEERLQGNYKKMEVPFQGIAALSQTFSEYIDWRTKHPSDDLMTQLLHVEFDDDTGVTRRLTRDEILTFLILISAAGNDTTNRLIGWIGKVLGDHPDQRRELVADPTLIPKAVEEVLRLEPPPYHVARYVARDTVFHGTTVPAGSVLLCLPAAANRDERQFPNPDTYDVHRKVSRSITFGYGAHHCLGAALARLEGRIVLEEVLKRFPVWEVDEDNAQLTDGFLTRGWDTLPVFVSRDQREGLT